MNLTIKAGDTRPIITDTLTYSDGSSVDLTGAAVTIVLQSAHTLVTTSAPAAVTHATAPATVSYTPTTTDTAVAGPYQFVWRVVFPDASVMQFPTVGFNELTVEPSLATGAPAFTSIVSLDDIHAHLNIPTTDDSHDVELQGFIDAATAVVTYNVGPVMATSVVETHVPRGSRICLDRVPVISVESVTEYIGQVAYTLTAQPPGATVDNWGYSLDLPKAGLIVRRAGAGVESPFWGSPVVVAYTAGLAVVPADIRMAVLEDLRGLYQMSQAGGRRGQIVNAGTDQWSSGPMRQFPRLAGLLEGAGRTQSIA